MLRKAVYILVGVVWLVAAAPASAQESGGDVQVKLSLAGDQTSFRIGDPIRLIIEFTADRDGYDVDTVTDTTGSPSDTEFVSPDSGVSHWLDEYFKRPAIFS